MNILVTSLGTSWSIVPELIGFTNPDVYDLYKNHPESEKIQARREKFRIEPVDELWVITTNGDKVSESITTLENWKDKIEGLPKIRLFSYKELVELNSLDEINPMSDLVYRAVLHAKQTAKGGKLFLSLAGGRKNMSADVQNAAYIFSCDALLHVMDDGNIDAEFDFRGKSPLEQVKVFSKIPGDKIKCFNPIVLQDNIPSSPVLFAEPKIEAYNFSLEENLLQNAKTDLFNEIQRRQKESANSLFSIYKKRVKDSQTTYSAFQLLPPEIVEQLQTDNIGARPENRVQDIAWLKKLPKAELHCHFGGILSPGELIEVARENWPEIDLHLKNNQELNYWWHDILHHVENNDLDGLPKYKPKESIRDYWLKKDIPEPIAISAFIMAFAKEPSLLKDYLFPSPDDFKGIGIEYYEKLGDLQGSSLLQNRKSIRKTCQILKMQCKRDNIKYMEVRCSPMNYTRGGLKAEKVVDIMMNELKSETTVFKLIFIASRHGGVDKIQGHIKLALEMMDKSEDFQKMFVGFDVAGVEAEKSPKELRDVFMPVLQKSIPTTIHAGENMSVKSIWEAVYHLSAERIGHGLTLNDDKSLKRRFKERKIAIELCPSSNDQIVGYNDFLNPVEGFENKIYPLKEYLNQGLKVTVNTDDPGISLTNLTKEYYQAACLTKGGLSKWEILQINRNGFKYGFLPLKEKKKLLLEVESKLFEMLSNE